MDLKKFGKALLFPHLAIMVILIPIATVFLVGSMLFLDTESPIAIASYVLAAYTLTVWCIKIPRLIKYLKSFKNGNKYAIKWQSDTRLRVNVSLYSSLFGNVLYGIFQLWLGFYHNTFWFYSFGVYYICLAVMQKTDFSVTETLCFQSGILSEPVKISSGRLLTVAVRKHHRGTGLGECADFGKGIIQIRPLSFHVNPGITVVAIVVLGIAGGNHLFRRTNQLRIVKHWYCSLNRE